MGRFTLTGLSLARTPLHDDETTPLSPASNAYAAEIKESGAYAVKLSQPSQSWTPPTLRRHQEQALRDKAYAQSKGYGTGLNELQLPVPVQSQSTDALRIVRRHKVSPAPIGGIDRTPADALAEFVRVPLQDSRDRLGHIAPSPIPCRHPLDQHQTPTSRIRGLKVNNHRYHLGS